MYVGGLGEKEKGGAGLLAQRLGKTGVKRKCQERLRTDPASSCKAKEPGGLLHSSPCSPRTEPN
jgi:hypothetical protein